jgi:hypothetical protein
MRIHLITVSEGQEKMSDAVVPDNLKIVLPYLFDEINRYRDWPIKILTFTSALHFAINGAFLLKQVTVTSPTRIAITVFIGVLWIWTIAVFRHCHLNYLRSRNIQASIQRKLGLHNIKINEEPVFPSEWFEHTCVSLCNRWIGWGFYGFYATGLSGLSVAVIWGWVKFGVTT